MRRVCQPSRSVHFRFCESALSDLGQVSVEFLFFDDEEVLLARLNQPEVAKSLHEDADSRPRGADYLGQFLVRNLVVDAQTFRVSLAKGAGQLQQRLPQALFAIYGHQMSNDLLLLG